MLGNTGADLDPIILITLIEKVEKTPKRRFLFAIRDLNLFSWKRQILQIYQYLFNCYYFVK